MKKLFLAFAIAALSSFSFAATSIGLERDDVSVTVVPEAKILNTRMVMNPNCPRGAMCLPRYEMTLAMTLGCLNRLGPVTANIVENDRTRMYDLFVTATEIVNKRSFTARCVRPNIQTVKLIVPGGMDKQNTNLIMSSSFLTSRPDIVVPPVGCSREFMPVCGTKPLECAPGQICATVMVEQTYGNKCLMRAAGAKFVHVGPCKR